MLLSSVAVFFAVIGSTLANRAFPLAAENFAIKQFQLVNPGIVYDETNYLVDLSGRYVVCSRVGQRGEMTVAETYEDGTPINGLIDYGVGSETHVNAVNQYIEETLEAWTYDPEFTGTIRGSTRFGCSVRPGCASNYVVGCVFDGLRRVIASTTPGQGDGGDEGGVIRAVAFTPEQYDLAEVMTGVRWDREHYLENLSGTATECGMIGHIHWDFEKQQDEAELRGMIVAGILGSALNLGDTQPAMEEIILSFETLIRKVEPQEIGCSIIPDCMYGGYMYVVISCLYLE